jgi:hypothetical protein
MRLLVIAVLLLVIPTVGLGQTRWTISAGPEWETNIGGRVRAEYDFIKPNKALRLRLELGGYWEPTQNFYREYEIAELGSVSGRSQSVDLAFGMTASLTPLPKALFAPYVGISALAQQQWGHGESWTTTPDSATYRKLSRTNGQMIFPLALGMRALVRGRMFQVEIRKWEHRNTFLVGTSLPF